MKGNNCIPEKTNIRRGKRFFDEFLSIKYDDLEKCLSNISENKKNIEIFDELYKKLWIFKNIKSEPQLIFYLSKGNLYIFSIFHLIDSSFTNLI